MNTQKQPKSASSRSKNTKRKQKKNNNSGMGPMQKIPIAQSRVTTVEGPEIRALSGGSAKVCVKHREFLVDVQGFGAANVFHLIQFPINPGLPTSFPWLATIANNYESYKFRKLTYHYKPTCSTQNHGTVVMAVDYDATDPAPIDKRQTLNMQEAVSSAPWIEIYHRSSKANLTKFAPERYTRAGEAPNNEDMKTYDVGNLFLVVCSATQGNLGELYVEYEIELSTPQMHTGPLPGTLKVTGNGSVTKDDLFGSTPIYAGDNFVAVVGLANQLVFTKTGEYLIQVIATGQGVPAAGSSIPIASNSFNLFANLTTATESTTRILSSYRASCTVPGQQMTFNLSAATSIAQFVVRIAIYAYSNN